MPGIDINNSVIPENGTTGSTTNNAISISPTKRAFMNAFANSLSRSLSMGSFSYKSLGKSLSQMSYGRSPLFDIYQQFKQSVPKNSLPPCIEEDEMVQDIEANFCKDFTCCGIVLKDLHELLQHFEDAHRMESDMEEEDDLPFEFDDLSSNRNNNDSYIPTLTDLFLKDLESKQRHMEESNLLNNGIGMQNPAIQQSIAMSDIYSEDKKLTNPITTTVNNLTNTSFSDILSNKIATRSNSTSIINSNISHLTSNLTRTNSTSSLGSKLNNLNNPTSINIPNNTTPNSNTIATPTSATTSNFNLSKNISAFNSAVSSTNSSTSSLFTKSGSTSQPQTPNLTHTTLANTAVSSIAATTATANASLAASSGFQAVNNLKNIHKLPSTKTTSTIQPAPVTTAAVTAGMHPLFPSTAVNPFSLLNNNGVKGAPSFNLLNTANQQMSEEPQEADDMDMDMDDASEMMNVSDPLLMAEAGPDEEKKYRCTVPGCNKSYKNPGGLKYHLQHGHFENTGDPEMDKIMHKPFQCTFENCGKRYKNMNGLKYHIEHSHTLFYNQQQGGLNQNHNVPLDSQQVLAFQALQMQQQLQQLQHIN